jgi:hypothetical protein
MKAAIALGFALVAATAAQAQDAPMAPHTEQQECLTWLSLASRFGPEDQHDVFDQQYLRLNGAASARTDLSGERKLADAGVAIDTYNKWVIDHFNANDETKATMLAEVMANAEGCGGLVPPDPAEATAPGAE